MTKGQPKEGLKGRNDDKEKNDDLWWMMYMRSTNYEDVMMIKIIFSRGITSGQQKGGTKRGSNFNPMLDCEVTVQVARVPESNQNGCRILNRLNS